MLLHQLFPDDWWLAWKGFFLFCQSLWMENGELRSLLACLLLACTHNTGWCRTDQQTIYALSAASGTLLWQHKFGGTGGYSFGGPSPSNGVLYCFGPGNTMYALDTIHGTLLWQRTFKQFENWLMGLNGIVYVLTEIITNDVLISAHVHAFNTSNGTLLWNY